MTSPRVPLLASTPRRPAFSAGEPGMVRTTTTPSAPRRAAIAARLGAEGVVVVRTMPGSPAEKAGLRGVDARSGTLGDVIVAVDGHPVRRLADLTDQLEQSGVGKTVEVSVKRNGGTTAVKIDRKSV